MNERGLNVYGYEEPVLCLAARHAEKSEELAGLLLQAGADVHATDDLDHTPLH